MEGRAMAENPDSPEGGFPVEAVEPTQEPPIRVGEPVLVALGAYLVLWTVVPCAVIVWRWPDKEGASSWGYERDLLLIAMLSGAVGACIHAIQSLVLFQGNRQFYRSWIPWYVLKPFMGIALAVTAYFVLRAGFVSTSSGDSTSPFVVGTIGALSGLCSKQVINKLSDICNAVFASSEARLERDKLREDADTSPPRAPKAETEDQEEEGRGD
jgi:uncharacterized membrane protein YsdA (DUF1294 family)